MKKSLKYLAVAAGNFLPLIILLLLWVDELELIFNNWILPIEFLKITGFSLLSLIVIAILVHFMNRGDVSNTATKIKAACLVTFLTCSYLYITYSAKFISNRIINRELRTGLAAKIKPASYLANGTKADDLSIQEYRQIERMIRFPKLPDEATNISYEYDDDGFLPDYIFTLNYFLPLQFKAGTFNFNSERYSKYQHVEIVNGKKKVSYEEGVN